MVALVRQRPDAIADAFGDWLIWAWGVNTRSDHGQGFVLIECELFEQALSAMTASPVRPGIVAARVAKMHRELSAYRHAVGRVTADESYDALVGFLSQLARDLALG